MTFKVIEKGAVRQTMYDFLLVRHCNYSSILYHLSLKLGAVSYSRIVGLSMAYIVWFARYSDLLVENREIFILHLYLAPPQGVTQSEFREDV